MLSSGLSPCCPSASTPCPQLPGTAQTSPSPTLTCAATNNFEISSCVCCLFTLLSSNSVTLVWSYLMPFRGLFLSLFSFLIIHLISFAWWLFISSCAGSCSCSGFSLSTDLSSNPCFSLSCTFLMYISNIIFPFELLSPVSPLCKLMGSRFVLVVVLSVFVMCFVCLESLRTLSAIVSVLLFCKLSIRSIEIYKY